MFGQNSFDYLYTFFNKTPLNVDDQYFNSALYIFNTVNIQNVLDVSNYQEYRMSQEDAINLYISNLSVFHGGMNKSNFDDDLLNNLFNSLINYIGYIKVFYEHYHGRGELYFKSRRFKKDAKVISSLLKQFSNRLVTILEENPNVIQLPSIKNNLSRTVNVNKKRKVA